MASIKDVAQLAGVSIGTVSRAFNNYSDICDETRQRIYEAAKSINYVPNINARNLSSKRNHSYALVISGFLDENPNESILVAHMRGVFQFAIKKWIRKRKYIYNIFRYILFFLAHWLAFYI